MFQQTAKTRIGVPPKGLIQAAALIHHTHQQGLPAAGRRKGQGEHVMLDNVRLNRIDGDILPGVAKGPVGMVKAVELMAFVALMPVVEKIVVEQRAADQTLPVTGEPQKLNQFQAEIGHSQTMQQHSGVPVLHGGVGKPKAGAGQQWGKMAIESFRMR